MISAQLGTEFGDSDYDGIKKVVSVWICFGIPDYIENAVAEYRMEKRDIIPGFPDRKDAYDKLSVVVIGLKEDAPYQNAFIGMMNTLLSPELKSEEKKEKLKTGYSMKLEGGLAREVELMCNLSGYVEERGIQKGKQEGLSALVRSLALVLDSIQQVYKAVIKNPEYADVTEEEVRQLMG